MKNPRCGFDTKNEKRWGGGNRMTLTLAVNYLVK